MLNVESDLTHATISSARSKMDSSAMVNGRKNTSSSAAVMTVTATQRLPPHHACTRSMTVQVATTMMAAQRMALRNG